MLLSITKNEIVYSLYISSFEQIKKNLDHKNPNYNTIQKICDNLNKSEKILSENNNLEKYSIILVNPVKNFTNKILEIIIKAYEEIIKDNLINDIILQKITPVLLHNINVYLSQNDINNKLALKILSICEMVYNYENIFIHNNYKTLLEICIKISVNEKENNHNKSIVNKTFVFFVNKIFKKITIDNEHEKNNDNYQINDVIKVYIHFLIDLIEIQDYTKNDHINIIKEYINIIQKQIENDNDINNNNEFKNSLEKLNLDKLNIYYTNTTNKIGKYGWCFLCKKTANNFNINLNIPICDSHSNDFEKNITIILFNSKELYYIHDYFEMLFFLSKIKISNIKTIELCLDTITEMINKGIKYFSNTKRMIELIKEILKDFVIKYSLSNNINIFKLSLDLFNIIYINYRVHLKSQIELFFMKIIINFLESEKISFQYKDIIMDNLFILFDKIGSNFFVEIFINFDLNSNYNAIFCVLINLFTKIINGLYLQNKYINTFQGIGEINIIVNKIFELLNKFIINLNDITSKKILNNFKNINERNNKNEDEYDEIIDYLLKNKIICDEEIFNQMKNLYIEDYNNNIINEEYSFTNKFIKEKKVQHNLITFIHQIKKENLPQIKYSDYTSYSIANHIFSNKTEIQNINSILYKEKILYYYIRNLISKFENKNILEALRILLSFIPLNEDEKYINKILLIFSEIFYEINQNSEYINIDMIYYVSFSLFKLNNNLHKENKQKKTHEKFVEEISQYYDMNITKGKYLYDTYSLYYDNIINEPLKFSNENQKQEILLEKENIFEININNNDLRKFMEFSWNNFLYIYNLLINESIKKINHELFFICLNNIIILSKICGIINLEKAQEMYLNTVLSMINLNEKSELTEIMIEVIIHLMNYINENCQNIKTNWIKILEIISILEYYLLEPDEDVILNLKNSSKNKFTEKEIKIFLNKRNNLSLNISDAICESIFSKTELFENEIIELFIQDLCSISKKEIDSFFIPRFFSLNKLVELCHFNLFRSPFYLRNIWKIISNYLSEIIIKYNKENIWKQALNNLKQIIIILLQKEEYLNINYKFQEKIFITLEKIFNAINKINNKGENIMDIIYFLVAQYGKNINWGWINIFNIIKTAFELNNQIINENIINILKYISNNANDIFYNNNIKIFEEFVQILCLIYKEKSMKPIAFENIISILDKIICEEHLIIKMPNSNKIYNFIEIFFYKMGNLMKINIIEYLNLLFEIINHNKKILLSKDLNTFIFIYYIYFKPSISILLLSKYENKIYLLNSNNKENNNIYYFLIDKNNNNNNEIDIIKKYLEENINILINNFNLKEGKEFEEIFYNNDNKNKLSGFLNEIKIKIDDNIFDNYIKNKINDIKNIDENNYELSIKYFLEKFKNMFINIQKEENEENPYIKYNYFYSDLLLTIQELAIFNSNSDLIYKIIFKIISSSFEELSELNKNKLINNNNNILKLLSFSKLDFINEKDLFKFIKYSLDFSNYFLDFIQLFIFDFTQSFKFISKLFNNILIFDLEKNNNFDKYKIINSSSSIVLLMKLQDIQLFIIKKTSKENLIKIKNKEKNNTIIYLNKIYEKYNICNDENSLMNKIIIFELENILPKFVDLLNNEELNNSYQCLINLIGSINHNIRIAAKNILKFLLDDKFILLKNK